MSSPALKHCLSLLSTALLLAGCGGNSDSTPGDLDDISVYKPGSEYTSTLADCARADTPNDYCSLLTLPLLGMEHNSPGVDEVMERVLVSHDWMGERFEEVLSNMPEEILPLFRSVTAIVIDADIRPAYYTTGTSAIYLDPAFLWLSVEEKRTINPKQDYRSGFDDPLAFRQVNRYVKNGASVYRHLPLTDDSTRELEDIQLLLARILLHELAHANDFFPPNSLYSINQNQTPIEAAQSLQDQWISSLLSESSPLNSNTMFSLAGVMYRGEEPTVDDLMITAAEVGMAFEPDGAADNYGYTNPFEDLAMLFETSMMKYLFDANYEIAFTGVPEDPSLCNAYIIDWGTHNRLGDDVVKARAAYVTQRLLPREDLTEFFENLEPPTAISGDWCIGSPEGAGKTTHLPHLEFIDPTELIRPYL